MRDHICFDCGKGYVEPAGARLNPDKYQTLTNKNIWQILTPDKYNPLTNINPWKILKNINPSQILTPEKYYSLTNIDPQAVQAQHVGFWRGSRKTDFVKVEHFLTRSLPGLRNF